MIIGDGKGDIAGGRRSLGDFLEIIKPDRTDYRSVSRTVNPMGFDVTAVLQKLEDRGEYPAVEFKNPLNMHGDPSEFRVVTNLWAARGRFADAVGIARSEAGQPLGVRLAEMASQSHAPEIIDADDAPVQAHVLRGDDADMYRFPVVRHAEMDLGGATTMGLVMRDPGGDFYNVTFVKAFPEPGGRAGLTIHSKDMSRMTRDWERRGEPFPVINVLGAHPAFWLGTLNNTPYGDNEYATVGGFLGEPLRLVPSVTWGKDFLVPADAEIVVEGIITPGERTVVDPFGEISGLYQPQELDPVMTITAITHRESAIYQDIFSGHREHMMLGSIPLEGALYNHLVQKMGIVTGVHLPYSGSGRHIAYVSIRKSQEHQAKMTALMAFANTLPLKVVVVVDDDIDVFSEEQVVWAMKSFVDPERDVDLLRNAIDAREPGGLGHNRVIFDATRTTNAANSTRLRVPPEAMERVKLSELLDDEFGE